jgi:hypothetical protein
MLREHYRFGQARFVIIPESNLAFEAQHIHLKLLEAFSRDECIVLTEDREKSGVRVDNRLKRGMAESLNERMFKQRLHIWKEYLSVSGQREAAQGRSKLASVKRLIYDEERDKLCLELSRFVKIVTRPRDPTNPVIVKYTGKLASGTDDRVMALFLAHTGRTIFTHSPKYASLRELVD